MGRRRKEAAAGQIRQNFFGSRKNSRSVSRDSRNWGGKTEKTKREKRQRRKRRQQTETAGSEALWKRLPQRGNRQEPPAKDPSRRKKPLKEQEKGRVAHPQVQSGRNAHSTMQQQKEGGPFNEGKGADLKGQSGNQTQCAHQRAEDPDVEPQPSHGKTGIRGRGLFRRFKGSFDRRALIGNVYAKFLFL